MTCAGPRDVSGMLDNSIASVWKYTSSQFVRCGIPLSQSSRDRQTLTRQKPKSDPWSLKIQIVPNWIRSYEPHWTTKRRAYRFRSTHILSRGSVYKFSSWQSMWQNLDFTKSIYLNIYPTTKRHARNLKFGSTYMLNKTQVSLLALVKTTTERAVTGHSKLHPPKSILNLLFTVHVHEN